METPARRARLRRGDSVRVAIEKLTHEGRGIAHVDGKVLFVDDALPGETVTATIARSRRNFDEASLETLHTSSPQRREPRCEWFGRCGGCSLQHLDHVAQLEHKQEWLLETLSRIGRVTAERVLEPLAAAPWGYRRRARLGVRFVHGKGRLLVGFRERYKSYITDMSSCEVLVPRAAALIAPLAELIGGLQIRERLPQIEVASGDDRLALVMRVLDPPSDADHDALKAFATRHDVLLCLQSGGVETVRTLDGEIPELVYRLEDFDLDIRFRPTDFVQVNAALNSAMIARVVAELAPTATDRVLDLYCGLGNFSLPLARRAGHVEGIEGSAELVARAQKNAQDNHLDNVAFHVGDLSAADADATWKHERWDLVLLDPPRSGAAGVIPFLQEHGPRRIAYVSCHPATLARDAGALVNEGAYTLTAAGVMDMFPHTAHVESLAIFERGEAP